MVETAVVVIFGNHGGTSLIDVAASGETIGLDDDYFLPRATECQ